VSFAFLVFQGKTSLIQGVWPITIIGWLTTIGMVFSVGAVILGWGKLLEKLNGYGERLNTVEKNQGEARIHRQELQRNLDRILDQHAVMLERLSEAKSTSERCDDDMQEIAINIGSRLDTVQRDINGMNLQLSQRLRAVETVLKIKE
jgi:hypothetical protein